MTQFTVPGQPAPWTVWARRSAPPPGFLVCQAWQAQIQAYARQYWYNQGNRGPTKGLVRLRLEFWLAYPSSAPKSRLSAKKRWLKLHRGMKPDIDNLQKACSDALQGILYVNDSQVAHIESTKDFAYGPEGYTNIWMEGLT